MRPLSITFLIIGCLVQSPARAADRAQTLRVALDSADQIVVKDPDFLGKPQKSVFVIRGADKIAVLVKSLEFDDKNSGSHCMCLGDSNIIFYKGEKELANLSYHHGHSLRWISEKWNGDSLFTPMAAVAWRTWFKDQGEPQFENMHITAEREAKMEKDIHEKFLACFPTEAALIFERAMTGDDAGMLSFSPKNDTSQPSMPSPQAKKLQAVFNDKIDFGISACRALGSLAINGAAVGSWSVISPSEQIVLECARTLSGTDFEATLARTTEVERVGAARLFFFESLGGKITASQRAVWAARLAKEVLTKDHSGNASDAIRALRSYLGDETIALLVEVANGAIKPFEVNRYNDEPGNRASACLLLAEFGHADASHYISLLKKDKSLTAVDNGALQVADCIQSKRAMDASIFKINSLTVGLGAVSALEKAGTKEALDALITGGTEHMYAAIREESVLAVERITGKKWFGNDANERAEWHGKDIREWWRTHRDAYQSPARSRQ